MLTQKIIDLNNTWLVFKRVKKTNWYHRGPNYVTSSAYAHRAVQFATKEAAQEFCNKINVGRKSYKFKIDTASKHFVNNWKIEYAHWSKEVVISSKPIGLDRLSSKQGHFKYNSELDSLKNPIIEMLNRDIQDYEKSLKQEDDLLLENLERAKRHYEDAIVHANKNHAERKTNMMAQQTKLLGMKTALETTDLDIEYVEKFGTQLDKRAKILFGSKI